IPVATVAINGAKNAGLLAAQILGVKYKEIRKKIKAYKKELKQEVEKKAENLENLKYKEYLKIMPSK
ncbi:5-(carboxyamino)imidazole ribonucleotide mutase, partial [bacterium]|nr:5-(carboxyamino)imidazole ribonucleotide mutase [bacterium]